MVTEQMNDAVKQEVDHYLSLNYHKRLYKDEDGDWVAEVDDLPGCVADGGSPDEAIENLTHAMVSWLRSRIEARLPVPEPTNASEYSGKILLRMPKFLHRRLSLQAQAEGTSLNQYLVSLLADASARIRTGSVMNLATSVGCAPTFAVGMGSVANFMAAHVRPLYFSFNALSDPNPSAWQEYFYQSAQCGVRRLLGQSEPRQDVALEQPRDNFA